MMLKIESICYENWIFYSSVPRLIIYLVKTEENYPT